MSPRRHVAQQRKLLARSCDSIVRAGGWGDVVTACVLGLGALTRSGLWTGGCLVTECLLLQQQSAPVLINPFFFSLSLSPKGGCD